jgi:hypothetical protein
MKGIIGCEESQAVTKAFRALGHEVYSCDLQDCSGGHPEWHIKGDVLEQAYSGKYDFGFFHPPCTFLTNSGVRWLDIVDGKITNWDRMLKMRQARDFFMLLYHAPIDVLGLENPIPHRHAGLPRYTQLIQPWQFGHGETKATCLWLKNLPKLRPTNIVPGREQRIWKIGPGPDRAKLRSKTYSGIAEAMASQWSQVFYHQLKLAI